jgi:RNA polymerase sigma factor (sigma-70 family)
LFEESSKYASKTNRELLEDCLQERSDEPWQEFVRRFQPLISGVVANVAYRCGIEVSTALIDELSQETYLKLFVDDCRSLKQFSMRHETAFFGFLKVVAANVAHDHFRGMNALKRGIQVTVDLDGREESQPSGPSRLSVAEENLLFEDIDTALKKITEGPTAERDRNVFWLHYQQGLTAEAIASIPAFKLTSKGVSSLLSRLIILLKRELVKKDVQRFSAKDCGTY